MSNRPETTERHYSSLYASGDLARLNIIRCALNEFEGTEAIHLDADDLRCIPDRRKPREST
jgi:hypothetical protein